MLTLFPKSQPSLERVVSLRCFKSDKTRHLSERRCGSISFSGTSEESVAEVIRELSSLGFEVWNTYLGDHGVTLAFT